MRDLVVEIAIPRRAADQAGARRLVRGAPGRRLGIVGESGSGKSLTALSLMRLLPPRARIAGGEVLLGGEDLARLSEARWRACGAAGSR